MNSRERVKKAIHFGSPDRPPISHAILPSAILHYGQVLQEILANVSEDFGWSCVPDLEPENYPPYYKKGGGTDAYGVLWECEIDGEYGMPVSLPLEDWSAYPAYRWPVFDIKPTTRRLYSGHMCHPPGTFCEDYYSRGGWIQLFELMQQLRGFENVLMDLAGDAPEVYRLRDDLLNLQLDTIRQFAALRYDGLHFADDWGSQRNLLIQPALWRKFFKPAYKTMFDAVHAAGMDVFFHSDGVIIDIIPDLIEVGVDVLNAQVNIMDMDHLRREFNGHLCFRTDLDRQNVTLLGTPDDVRKHIRHVFETLGSDKGGIIACGEIGRDTPLDNIKAMYETFMSFRFQ